jgi:hypothetical protein
VSRPRFSRGRDLFNFSSQFNLLGNTERIIDLDAEVANSAFKLRAPAS